MRNVHSCGVFPGGSLNSSLLGPHSFLASCCPGFGWHNCLFIMLLLPGRDEKAVIWNSGSYIIFSGEELFSKGERTLNVL